MLRHTHLIQVCAGLSMVASMLAGMAVDGTRKWAILQLANVFEDFRPAEIGLVRSLFFLERSWAAAVPSYPPSLRASILDLSSHWPLLSKTVQIVVMVQVTTSYTCGQETTPLRPDM